MNRRQLRESIYLHTGLEQSDTMVTTNVVDALINDAIHRIEIEHDWPWLMTTETLTTTANVAYVTPAPTALDWVRTRALTVTTTGYPVEQLASISDYRKQDSTARSDTPSYFTVINDLIYLWPVPSGAFSLTHDYVQAEPDLSSDQGEPAMPASFHQAIVEYASYLVLARVRDDERAAAARARFQELMSVMKDNRRRVSGPMLPRVREDSWI